MSFDVPFLYVSCTRFQVLGEDQFSSRIPALPSSSINGQICKRIAPQINVQVLAMDP